MSTIRLIVGLGNPGDAYLDTRHNAGFWFIRRLLGDQWAALKPHAKFHGLFATRVSIDSVECSVLVPTTYMNHSGFAVRAVLQFYKLPTESLLIAHDELDLPPGIARFKRGGGHAGHQGIKHIIEQLGGDDEFYRVRIGIGRPADPQMIAADYVLSRPPAEEKQRIDSAIQRAVDALPEALAGNWEAAMQELHSPAD